MNSTSTTGTRGELDIDGRRLSYLDFGGPGRPLLALHGHLYEGQTWAELARALAPRWRVIAPDQRGHGDSDRTPTYTREDYVADAIALLDHLEIEQTVTLGHSGGGITAFQIAARHPRRVSAIVNVEGPPCDLDDGPSALSFVLSLPYTAPDRQALLDAIGPLAPMLADKLRPTTDGGWRLPFHPHDTIASEQATHGDHWADWTATDCPALFVLARDSQVLTLAEGREAVARRANTHLAELDGDHFVHTTDPQGFATAVKDFLDTLE
ncbi:alpha/beta fold hydrolase [Amycolatopsis magusensis]|uniref:Pimeloyl-ACP methyl ester carboxylesterase n=1 Tax=Amycolatopsis magusensis TaxID=882444 RepID=A0ABS4Q142_9PSEU|nr:alpha/beta hydrolase [Amycolatopsis magusensis]MBP2185395.1 pimeloyl-ACP methyl ester carboxylesterase [Amycolatopsis magusensis]